MHNSQVIPTQVLTLSQPKRKASWEWQKCHYFTQSCMKQTASTHFLLSSQHLQFFVGIPPFVILLLRERKREDLSFCCLQASSSLQSQTILVLYMSVYCGLFNRAARLSAYFPLQGREWCSPLWHWPETVFLIEVGTAWSASLSSQRTKTGTEIHL